MSRIAYSLLAASLLLTAATLPEEEYFFDEEAEEEAVSSHVPKFTSQSETQVVKAGDSVTLPCLVNKLGEAVIIWKAGNQTLFTSSYPSTKDDRFSLEDKGQLGSSLVIRAFSEKDSHVYQCQITSTPPITIKHHVMIQTAPSVTVQPRGGVKVANEGQEVVLECTGHGYPQPNVTWTKKGGLLPYQEKRHYGERLVIPAVKGAHMGDYSCTVENGVGQPVVEHIRLEVNFAPEIEVTSDMVYTGPGHEATLECSVRGQPLPQVMWYRVRGTDLDESHFQRYQDGYRYGIRIADVRDDDFGVYTCQAENAVGQHTGTVHLTGKPKPVKITSEPNGNDKDTYKIQWTVESFAKPIEYKILFRKLQESDDEPDSQWSEMEVPFAADPDQADGNIVYQQQAELKPLQSASVYQAIVTAHNQHGWSEPGRLFKFSTLGANESAGGIRGGEALVSDQRNGAPFSPFRVAGLCLLSGLLATLVALL